MDRRHRVKLTVEVEVVLADAAALARARQCLGGAPIDVTTHESRDDSLVQLTAARVRAALTQESWGIDVLDVDVTARHQAEDGSWPSLQHRPDHYLP